MILFAMKIYVNLDKRNKLCIFALIDLSNEKTAKRRIESAGFGRIQIGA